jgi:alkanesulfonate monooxygenase SsuD/methylene tetrahydromethanopterin reductase-like flavin-dependent oxidoreductase (luciferase family)
VCRGYHSREVDTYGAPSTNTDSDANRDLFEEQVEVILKTFNNQSFSHHGKTYDLPPKGLPYRG